MSGHTPRPIRSEADLLAADAALDLAICGRPLTAPERTRFADEGAHDPTPTPYFVLRELFAHYSFGPRSHLLDVGCNTGRVLAHFVHEGCPGRATGIELDPALAAVAQAWCAPHPTLQVIQGNVLDADLSPYTDFYLFNPFDGQVLIAFIGALEAQVQGPCTVVHMSDNGDSWWYRGRTGWTEVASGTFQHFRNERGVPVTIYEDPQHYTVWRFEP